LLGSCCAVFGQNKTKSQLQKEKQQSVERIKEVEKILNETTAKKKNTLGELSALNQRIIEQQNLINSIRKEINLLNGEIRENNDIIQVLDNDLKKLKEEYAAMLFAAQKASNSTTRLTFLFSSESFDQLVMRLRYMEQYGEARKLQAELISQVQAELGQHVKQIESKREEKNKLLADGERENSNLAMLKKKQSGLVKALEKEEKKLKRDLEETRKALAVLDRKINDIIKEEMEREALAVKNTKAASVALSSSFEENKSKLPWPVSTGFISQRFGRQNHPVLKGIVLQNDGVNIQTKQNEKVKSIFDGEVRSVAFIPAFGSTVIINHGEYYSVYTGLKEVYVKTGQKVATSQEIGQVISNAEGICELRFQIRKKFTPLDPQAWLVNM
jgi:septal ring factor EnvC (AmiA/AmiB activator)